MRADAEQSPLPTDIRPALRSDVHIHRIGPEAVAWSEPNREVTYLDPVATVMLDVVDGVATAGELAEDIQFALDVDRHTAWAQIKRILSIFDGAGLLTAAHPGALALKDLRTLLPDPDW